jgi:hypothetical protein
MNKIYTGGFCEVPLELLLVAVGADGFGVEADLSKITLSLNLLGGLTATFAGDLGPECKFRIDILNKNLIKKKTFLFLNFTNFGSASCPEIHSSAVIACSSAAVSG